MRVSFPAADATEAVTGEENGKESHEEEVNAIAPKGGDGTGIGFLVNPAQGWSLTGRKEEAAMLFKAGIFSRGFNALGNSDETFIREEKFQRLVGREYSTLFQRVSELLQAIFISAERDFSHASQDGAGFIGICSCGIQQEGCTLNETHIVV